MSTAPKRSKVPKRSKYARAGLPQSLKLAPSKRSNSVRLPSRMESWVQNWRPSYQCVLWFSHPMCIQCCACPEKGRPGHTKCCACHAKSSEHPWRFDAPKCNPSQEISTLISEHVWWICCTASAKRHASFADLFQTSPRLPSFLKVLQTLHARVAHFWQGAEPLAPATKTDGSTSKSGPNVVCFTILTSKCASRHNAVHFFDISTSKSGARPSALTIFDLRTCFSTTACTFLEKCSENGVPFTFWHGSVLGATAAHFFEHLNVQTCSEAEAACTFSTSYLIASKSAPNMVSFVRLAWSCASHHSGVHFCHISISEPEVVLTFWLLQTCFAPQRRAIFDLSAPQMAPHPPL